MGRAGGKEHGHGPDVIPKDSLVLLFVVVASSLYLFCRIVRFFIVDCFRLAGGGHGRAKSE